MGLRNIGRGFLGQSRRGGQMLSITLELSERDVRELVEQINASTEEMATAKLYLRGFVNQNKHSGKQPDWIFCKNFVDRRYKQWKKKQEKEDGGHEQTNDDGRV